MGRRHIILFVFLCFTYVFIHSASAACSSDQYECIGSICIEDAKRNDSQYDCPRYDDEGIPLICDPAQEIVNGQILQRYKCKDGSVCILESQWYDGVQHCADLSDEFKYIGSECNDKIQVIEDNIIVEKEDPFQCDVYMADSLCSGSKCACRSGAYANADNLGCTVRIIGDACDTDPDCEDAVEHSECPSSLCVCDQGFMEVDPTLCRLRKILDPCATENDCEAAVTNSECSGFICLCESGYKVNDDNTECTLRKIEDDCSTDPDCSDAVGDSECTDTPLKCKCTYNYTPETDLSSCRLRVLGDPCVADDHCLIQIGDSICAANVCECKLGYKGTAGTTTCTKREIGDACETNEDCSAAIDASVCESGVCVCPSGYYLAPNATTCVPRQLGDTCTSDADCTALIPNTICTGTPKICQCDTGYYEQHGACVARVLGDSCNTDDDCLSIEGAICDGTCKCPDTLTESGGKCVSVPKGECIDANDCSYLGDLNQCVDGKCDCSGTFVVSSDGNSCVEPPSTQTPTDPPNIGDPCSGDGDCPSTAACIDGVCSCPDGLIQDGSTCIEEPVAVTDPFPWWIIGVIIGVILLLILLALIIYFCLRKKKKQKEEAKSRPEKQSGEQKDQDRPKSRSAWTKGNFKLKFPLWFANSTSPVMYEDEKTKPPPDIAIDDKYTLAEKGSPRKYQLNVDQSLYQKPEYPAMYDNSQTIEPFDVGIDSRYRDWSLMPNAPVMYEHPDTTEPVDVFLEDEAHDKKKVELYKETSPSTTEFQKKHMKRHNSTDELPDSLPKVTNVV